MLCFIGLLVEGRFCVLFELFIDYEDLPGKYGLLGPIAWLVVSARLSQVAVTLSNKPKF